MPKQISRTTAWRRRKVLARRQANNVSRILQSAELRSQRELLNNQATRNRQEEILPDATDGASANIVEPNSTNEGADMEEQEFDNAGDGGGPADIEGDSGEDDAIQGEYVDSRSNTDNDEEIISNYSEDEEDNGNIHRDSKQKLYTGSKITVLESMLMIMTFKMHFKIPWEAISMLLVLLDLHMPLGNKLVKSVYFLRKYFACTSKHYKKHTVCKKCHVDINEKPVCKDKNGKDEKVDSFLTFNIEKQLKQMFQRESFRNSLMYRFNRVKIDDDAIEDIYDSEIYMKNFDFFNNPFNFSLMFYSDGISVFKSSKSSVWPLFFVVNELPYRLRFLPQNIILGGLWYGKYKPHFNTFVLPLVHTFNKLRNGLKISIMNLNKKFITVKCMLLNGIGDSPAKALMLYMTQFNGNFGCPKCLIQGKSLHLSNNIRKKVWIYPYEADTTLRTSEDSIVHGERALDIHKPVYGIRGVSVFSKLVPDYIKGMGIDIMHSLISGSGGKKLMELWFSAHYKNEQFSLHKKIKIIEERLLQVKPPNFVTRPPRPITTHFALYKASEFKNWFFYYAIPILHGVMEEKFFSNFFNLVFACAILCNDFVVDDDIEIARKMLIDFVIFFQREYGERFMSSNIHSLLHLADCVKEIGPLWVSSCFPLEDLNGKIVNLVNGTFQPEIQIADSFNTLKMIPILTNDLEENSVAKQFIQMLKIRSVKVTQLLRVNIAIVGKISPFHDIPDFIKIALDSDGMDLTGKKIWQFHRLQIGQFLYIARSYARASKNHISYCVSYEDHEVGFIEHFLKMTNCDCGRVPLCECETAVCAIMRKCEVKLENSFTGNFVQEYVVTNDFCVADITTINRMLFCTEYETMNKETNTSETRTYVTWLLNKSEFE